MAQHFLYFLIHHCQIAFIWSTFTVYSIANKTADNISKVLDLIRCSAWGNHLLYNSTYTGAGADIICNENHIILLLEVVATLTRAFYCTRHPLSNEKNQTNSCSRLICHLFDTPTNYNRLYW